MNFCWTILYDVHANTKTGKMGIQSLILKHPGKPAYSRRKTHLTALHYITPLQQQALISHLHSVL